MNNRNLLLALAFCASTFGSHNLVAQTDSKSFDLVRSQFEKMVADPSNLDIKETETKGVFLVGLDGQFVHAYVHKDKLLIGEFISTKSGANLTEAAKKTWTKDSLGKMDPNQFVTFGSKQNTKNIYLFTDADCGYCRKFHQAEVKKLNDAGVNVNYLAFPRAGLGSVSHRKLESVWCSDEPKIAMTKAKKGEEVTKSSCDSDVVNHFQFGQRIGVTGTPSILFDDGTKLPGYRSAEQIIALLN